ncbi:hypothetical protein [Pseudolactococcus reticulitermitis]|uniref:Uncharacterized protein n=1 Tax=Pseudolactococcus reticulitermitis TaxID=2025039 RepID=A0A224XFM6_9LACT|nr:hypothetical protein [Lactococcus reticulitermitis]GAX48343.1 hypothetical protein RsY01_1964 [Lactococcus reticulitermitis]
MIKLNKKVVSAIALITIGVVAGGAGTFAKYTKSVETLPNTARLAKYSFNKTNELDLFADSYDGTVLASDGAKVIAPGTTNEASIKFVSDSEVKTETVVQLTGVTATEHLLSRIKINNVKIDSADSTPATLADIKAALEADKTVQIGDTTTREANATNTIEVPVTWTYVFEEGADATYDEDDTREASKTANQEVTLTFVGINTQID